MPSSPGIISRFTFPRVVLALMLREMSSQYGRSIGGYFWAFLEPIGALAMFTIVVGFLARVPALGTNFPLFYATGFLPFSLYQLTATRVGQSIRFSRSLLSYPNVSFIDAIVARFLLVFLTQVVVASIILIGIVLIYGLHLNVDLGRVLRGIAMAATFGLGVGLVNCYFMSLYPIYQSIWSILTRPLFLISGIFFVVDYLPEPAPEYLSWNPIAQSIMMMRTGIFDTYEGTLVSETYTYFVSVTLIAFGLMLLYRYHRLILSET